MTGVTIIIPARNEEEIIIRTLRDILKKVKIPHNIIVVNDCSTDNTEDVVKKYSKKHKNISVVNNSVKTKGFSQVLKLGFKNCKTEFAIPVMADLCDNPKTINNMYKIMDKGYDIVCGSRYMKGGRKTGGPKLQGFFSWLVCKTLQVFTGINTSDVSNAFKMYRKTILKKVKFNPKSGVEASMELTLQAYFKGAKITEVPTVWRGRTVGVSKFKLIERTPRYARIFFWSIDNSARRYVGLPLRKFYA